MNTTTTQNSDEITILYENGEWMEGLFTALSERGLSYQAVDVSSSAFLLDDPGDYGLVINRVSPSAALRGNGAAIGLTQSWLDSLERRAVEIRSLGSHGQAICKGSAKMARSEF